MSLSSVLIGAFGGSVVALIAKKAVDVWAKNKGALEAELIKDVKKVDTYFEDHWGIDLLDDDTNVADKIVSKGVAWVDQYAGSAAFMRLVLNNIMTMNPAKFSTYVEQLKNIDLAASIKGLVDTGLLQIIQQTKKEVAVKVIENKAILADVVINNVPAKVEAAVVANKVNEPAKPITPEVMSQLIIESQKRQEALKAHTS